MELTSYSLVENEQNPWLVLIHGFGGSKNTWKHQIESFKNCFNLLFLELPGHGDATCQFSDFEPADFTMIGEAIVDYLRKKSIHAAHFMSLSLGTLIMSRIIEHHPEMVLSNVMVGGIFGMHAYYYLLFRGGNLIKHIVPYQFCIEFFAFVLMPRSSHARSRTFLVRECLKMKRKEFVLWYGQAVKEIDCLLSNLVNLCKTRTLVVMGDEDNVFLNKAVQTIDKLKDQITLEIIEHCGHVCNLQKWREFNEIACRFLLLDGKSAVV